MNAHGLTENGLSSTNSSKHWSPDNTVKLAVTLHTDLGDIKIEIFCERAPKTCENFLALCASGFYKGCIFHRNIKGFMVQTGDPTGTGKGGTSIWGRKFEDEFSEHLKHNVRGVVSMANNGPNTNGSQFFFTYAKQPHLDMKYTVFGKIIDGLEALDELEKLPVHEKTFRPLTESRIKDVTIHANPFAG
ncbi:peptidyl-prolyl cis-trans isomerase-like 3 isoform X1 [Syngnathus scovelli]|uniref:peptidyl-prolyl cis-trans isomerase-like 3 isoform X1 n=1 Tax=Syngnathus scovelli TaxID=161590 RepID=UPI00210FC023|nr:peptidyl-prolyl cis-trans isomerase-like 3 isoform X1 [Syngnathus scovelli]